MLKQNLKLILTFCFAVFLFAGVGKAQAADIFVATTGNDSTGNGSNSAPYKTIAKGLAVSKSGDTVVIGDGTYSTAALVIPRGVSVTSKNLDPTKVIISPASAMTYLVYLSDTALSQNGNQSLSYVTLQDVSDRAANAFQVKNRNNVRINNCIITGFYDGTPPEYPNAMEVISTRIPALNNGLKYFLPLDMGEPGDDSGFDTGIEDGTVPCAWTCTPETDISIKWAWPSAPVTGFQFDNNTVTACGKLRLYNVKDSRINHNYFDNTTTSKECMGATAAFLNNVEIDHNTFLGMNHPTSTNWRVEFWMFRGGCKIHDNISNGFYSITYGKELHVYNNYIYKSTFETGESNYQVAIEFNGHSQGLVENNYINYTGAGIFAGSHGSLNKALTLRNNVIRNNVWYKNRVYCMRINSQFTNTSLVQTVKDFYIYNNVIDGPPASPFTYAQGFSIHEATGHILSNINIKNNVVKDQRNRIGTVTDTVDGLKIINNDFYGNTDGWSGSTGTYTGNILADPSFVNEGTGYAGYALKTIAGGYSANSPALNTGTWLTTITSATGSGTNFVLADAGYFKVGDQIQIQNDTAPVTVTAINYVTKTVTVNSSVGWTSGEGVSTPFYGSKPDIGAIETGLSTPTLQADLNSDNKVDIFDFSILLSNFGKTNDCQNPADINNDCSVNIFDYNLLSGEFGRVS